MFLNSWVFILKAKKCFKIIWIGKKIDISDMTFIFKMRSSRSDSRVIHGDKCVIFVLKKVVSDYKYYYNVLYNNIGKYLYSGIRKVT